MPLKSGARQRLRISDESEAGWLYAAAVGLMVSPDGRMSEL